VRDYPGQKVRPSLNGWIGSSCTFAAFGATTNIAGTWPAFGAKSRCIDPLLHFGLGNTLAAAKLIEVC
jgi:hypothetical protein